MSYVAIKHLHITFAVLSAILFFVRGLLMLAESGALRQKWLRILPHVVDTGLLASAITLVLISGQYPFVQGWLTAKLLALVAYIVLGIVAFRPGRTKGVRTAAFVSALIVFAYIVKVALTKQVL